MDALQVVHARAAAATVARSLDLTVEVSTVLRNSNKLALHLQPCETFARVAHVGREVADFEVELARQLALSVCPVAALDPRVPPAVYRHDGFAITFWTFYRQLTEGPVPPDAYATALARLHAGLREVVVVAPHFMDRVTEAQGLTEDSEQTPALSHQDRRLLGAVLSGLRERISAQQTPEQLLHGEPHPGNLLSTSHGARFIDLETCCRGPIEFDLAHAPTLVSSHYPNVNTGLLDDCNGLALALVAAWRMDRTDGFPNGLSDGHKLLNALRHGPPWPSLIDVLA